ncbi:Crp/Fnr family transcriptional regulator [Shewanella olleyana]|uniref:Crp/Fnr family transcriptional regulator n=1 Tax=Shewanella olleyana TaxID=135626 RepID=UPI00200BA759|nr:Crp/Fnr family transcriptional regulator [Shewanella olleyana]MCL1068982.1 Crp/Fnr family transcriptional regulator [Shewanella olleyana]
MTSILTNQIIWPCELSERTKADILDVAIEIDGIDKYSTLIDGDHQRGLLYCVQGLGTFATTSLDNRPLASFIFGKQMWVGAVAIEIYPKINLYTCELEPLKSLFFPKKDLNTLAETNGEVYKLFYSIMRTNSPKLVQGMHLSFYGIEERINFFLLELARSKKLTDSPRIEIKITQQQLSEIANVSRPRVNEILNKFAQQGFIELVRGKMIITDYAGMCKALEDKVVM